ncbi:MAG: FHA domain-containing protein [Kofleriaceae bacterium]|nr:FHA domain-containing protein [Myxococcales bacterium]MCB9562714.1 FHA domain-containing protein [Kofleriaceae bacterium]MCB9571034.1 FHA domain-containing protein [Kofleriaceae bacterium]
MKIVIDHVSGSRRGQRQELVAEGKVRFGRHPECEVSFDAHKDIDASSRHAELRPQGDDWILVDVGSSNGTYVDGRRVTEVKLVRGVPATLELGPGGPRMRIFLGDDDEVARLAAPEVERPAPRRGLLWAVVLVVAVAALAAVAALLR